MVHPSQTQMDTEISIRQTDTDRDSDNSYICLASQVDIKKYCTSIEFKVQFSFPLESNLQMKKLMSVPQISKSTKEVNLKQ